MWWLLNIKNKKRKMRLRWRGKKLGYVQLTIAFVGTILAVEGAVATFGSGVAFATGTSELRARVVNGRASGGCRSAVHFITTIIAVDLVVATNGQRMAVVVAVELVARAVLGSAIVSGCSSFNIHHTFFILFFLHFFLFVSFFIYLFFF